MQPFKYNPNFNSGSFRHKIIFLAPQSVEDELGQSEINWVKYKSVWAMIRTVKGSEYIGASTEQGELIYRFVTHFTPGITRDMRIDFNGRIFDIIEPPINDDEMNKTLTILAKERV
jgi:SPP1 family predicted phage head-tail adaptor